MQLNNNHFNSKVIFSTVVELLCYRATYQASSYCYTFAVDQETSEQHLTYGELDQQARAIAAQLQSFKATGERALLLYPPGIDFIFAFFGCLYAGVVAIPVHFSQSDRSLKRIQAIAADAGATIAITTNDVFSKLNSKLIQIPQLKTLRWLNSDSSKSELAHQWLEQPLKGDTLAYLQYTSGSTSTPKGVMVSHKNVLHNCECIKQAFELTPESVSLSWLPHFHDMGLIAGIILPLYTGIRGILMPPISFFQQPLRWLQAISRYQATYSGAPNFAYELCLRKITPAQKQSLNLKSWKIVYTGSEPINSKTLNRFGEEFKICGLEPRFLYPCYGLAEATLMVSGGLVNSDPVYCNVMADELEQNRIVEAKDTVGRVKKLVGCGRSWLDTTIVIVDPQSLIECGSNEVGEIWVSGESVTQGYWNRPEDTKQTFQSYLAHTNTGPFLRTGDLGFFRDNELFITGRLKEIVIIRGRNHYPQDIELTVQSSHPALLSGSGAAFSVEIEGEEKLVVVFEVERSYLEKLDVETVAGNIRAAVAEQHELQVYAVVLIKTSQLPKTTSGKVQRRACRESFLANTLSEVGRSVLKSSTNDNSDQLKLTREEILAMAPEKRRERLINYLHELVLRVAKISLFELDSSKFLSQLGMDSLKVIELNYHLESQLKVKVSVVDFFYDLTLAELAAGILAQLEDSPQERLKTGSSLIPIQPHGSNPPLFFIHVLGKGLCFCRPLASYLSSDLPIYGLNAQIIDKKDAPVNAVEDLADFYIKEILNLQPVGPYFLAGISFGGQIAYEMARKLDSQGHKVALLALIDTILPQAIQKRPWRDRLLLHTNNFLQVGLAYFSQKSTEKLKAIIQLFRKNVSYQLKKIYSKLSLTLGISFTDYLQQYIFQQENFQASIQYIPSAYSGSLTLFCALERKTGVSYFIDPQLGWEKLALGGLEIYHIPGDHLGILQDPNVQVLAEKLQYCIDKAKTNVTATKQT